MFFCYAVLFGLLEDLFMMMVMGVVKVVKIMMNKDVKTLPPTKNSTDNDDVKSD